MVQIMQKLSVSTLIYWNGPTKASTEWRIKLEIDPKTPRIRQKITVKTQARKIKIIRKLPKTTSQVIGVTRKKEEIKIVGNLKTVKIEHDMSDLFGINSLYWCGDTFLHSYVS